MVLGPTSSLGRDAVKSRWGERYVSDSTNKKFVGVPRGVYFGFVPVADGLVLTLKTDIVITYLNPAGSFTIGSLVTGGTSGATAFIRVASVGYLLVDQVDGTFVAGETITAAGASATVGTFSSAKISLARVVSNTPTVAGRTEDTVDIFTGDAVVLDFTGFADATYSVIVTASYKVGQPTTAQIITRSAPPPDGQREILICQVTKTGAALTLAATAPTTRHEPFAFNGQRIGFMPGGSIESLLAAVLTTQEVIAARQDTTGTVAPAFNNATPQTTGLPARLAADLARVSMAQRLGKRSVVVQGNDYAVTAPITTQNISGSFSGRNRDHIPFKDYTTGNPPPGVPIPLGIGFNGSEAITLTLTGVVGSFVVGNLVTGVASGATGIVHAVSGSNLDLGDLTGVFRTAESVTSAGPPGGSGTVSAIDFREGAITFPVGGDAEHNLVYLMETQTGRKPIDGNGNPIFGRLGFGPNGAAGPGGGAGGELPVASAPTEQLNFTQGSVIVTENNLDLTEYFLPGDIIEGADGRFYEVSFSAGSVLAGQITLSKPYLGANASAGFGVGPGPRRRRRFIVSFVSLSGGVESPATITPGTTIPSGASLRVFFPVWFLASNSNFDGHFAMRAPGDGVINATPSVPGVGYNAAPAGTPVIGAVRVIQLAGAPVGAGNYHTINFNGASMAAGGPGVLNITSPGPTGPTGPAGGGGGTGPTGPTGPGFTTLYGYQTFADAINAVADRSHVFPFGGPMRFYMVNASLDGAASNLDTGYITGVTAVSGNSSITVDYHIDNGGSTEGVDIVLGAAACG